MGIARGLSATFCAVRRSYVTTRFSNGGCATRRRLPALLCCLALLLTTLPALAAEAPPPGLRFAVVTDSHVGDSPSSNQTGSVLQAVYALTPAPDLVVHTGDLSEAGVRKQYDDFDALAKNLGSIPLIAAPGNHDARWLDMGKGEFERRYGAPHRSFTQGGVHFVLLDSTVDSQTWGHYARPMLDWLQADLAALPANTPVVVFAHHPVYYPPLKFTDNDDELLDTLQAYNVVALFTGHGHLHLRWRINGIPQFMTRAAMDGGFRVVDVAGGRLTVYSAQVGAPGSAPALTKEAELPLAPAPLHSRLEIDGVQQAGGRLKFTARGVGLTGGAQAWARLNQGAWQALTPQPDGTWQGDLAISDLPNGVHHLHAYATAEPVLPGKPATADQWNRGDLGDGWYAHAFFPVTGAAGPSLLWQTPVGGPVQGALAVDEHRVYAGSGDGAVHALAVDTGAPLWQTALGSPVTAGVTLQGGRLLAATVAGEVRALQPADGTVLWSARAEAPVLAEPAAAGSLVVVADAAGNVYGLDAATGARRWRFAAGAAVRSAPIIAAGAVYFGAWNGKAYALDAATGTLLWEKALHTGLYFSPANGSPLYFRGKVFFTAPTQNKTSVWGLNAADGNVLWSSDVPVGYSAPALHNGQLVTTTYGGWLRRLDPETGQEITPALSGGGDAYGPGAAPANGLVAFGLMNGRLAILDPALGKKVGEVALGDGWLLGRTRFAVDTVYVGTMAGSVAAVPVSAPPAPPLTWGDPSAPADAGAAQAPGFPDTRGKWMAPYVALLRTLGMAQGDSRGYRPDDPLTRAEWAALVARYLGLSGPPAGFKSQLTDLTGHWAAPYVQALEVRGLMQGEVGEGGQRRFAPDRRLSRAEAAVVLTRLLGRAGATGGFQSSFADVGGHWALVGIAALEQAGLAAGESAGGQVYFRPDRPVSRAEAAVFLVRLALGRDPK